MLLVVDNGTHFRGELERALATLELPFTFVTGHESLQSIDAFEGAILTGGRVHVFQATDLASVPLDDFLIEHMDRPVLGICLGHQLIAHHYGATVAPLPEGIDREETIELLREDPLFAGLPRHIRARVAHGDAVTDLAAPLMSLARSDLGEYEAIRHCDRPLYGLQFHPEASGDSGLVILANFAAVCAAADESPTDHGTRTGEPNTTSSDEAQIDGHADVSLAVTGRAPGGGRDS